MRQRSADVIIVGAGVAGSLAAARLAARGLSVLVLEAGPRVDRGKAFETFSNASIKAPESPYPNMAFAPHPRSEAIDDYYVHDGPEKFRTTYLRQVGGTTWHWLGTTLRFVPDDFRLRSRFGLAVDWPISYADLEPWYVEAERELGVAGDSAADLQAPRSQPYPLPPIPTSYLDERVRRALARSPYAVVPTPQARNSRAHDGRPACCGSGSCIPICPVQAKYDATVHVTAAERAGAQLVEEAVVSAVEVGSDRRVSLVRVKRPDGSEEQAVGKVYVIAAHGIETPKLLIQSQSERVPGGVANSSDQVGRNLMDHPIQLSWALSAEPVWPYRGPISTSGIESPRAAAWRRTRPAFRIQISADGWSWPMGAPASTVRALLLKGLRGEAFERALADHTARELQLAMLTEQLPLAENRIVPDFERRDSLGLPRPRITYTLDDYTRRGLEEGRRVHGEIFGMMNATEIHHSDAAQASGHIIGTYRMGRDPKSSVVDADLRSHDHPNLFLLGSGVFPTSAASNPTLTIAALSLRAAAAIAPAMQV
jgi:choline dehydrogenase-like flavoprotein